MNEECKRCNVPSEDLCNLINDYECLRIVAREFLERPYATMEKDIKYLLRTVNVLDKIVEDFNKEHGLE